MEDMMISPEESRFLQLMDMVKNMNDKIVMMNDKIDYNKMSIEGQIKVFQESTSEKMNSDI
jgi:hypothetical protein